MLVRVMASGAFIRTQGAETVVVSHMKAIAFRSLKQARPIPRALCVHHSCVPGPLATKYLEPGALPSLDVPFEFLR
jgi:hypothetical protein